MFYLIIVIDYLLKCTIIKFHHGVFIRLVHGFPTIVIVVFSITLKFRAGICNEHEKERICNTNYYL